MKNWNDYKEYVKSSGDIGREDIEIIEAVSRIVETMISKRTEMGLTQRELAALCKMPQSSIARIESYKTIPNLETLLKIFKKLELNITVDSKTNAV